MVTKTEMENYWKFLSLAYVTEESDDPDNPNGIIEHKLTWCSSSNTFAHNILVFYSIPLELDEFMQVLDERLQMKQQHQTVGLVAKKFRTVGQPSDSLPPPGAPTWAIRKTDSQNGNVRTFIATSLSPSPLLLSLSLPSFLSLSSFFPSHTLLLHVSLSPPFLQAANSQSVGSSELGQEHLN